MNFEIIQQENANYMGQARNVFRREAGNVSEFGIHLDHMLSNVMIP
jgi:hypothetical protein